jgi:hypothetical protein
MAKKFNLASVVGDAPMGPLSWSNRSPVCHRVLAGNAHQPGALRRALARHGFTQQNEVQQPKPTPQWTGVGLK